MKEAAELIGAIGSLLWPAALVAVLLYFRKEIRALLTNGSEFGLKVLGNELTIKPSARARLPEKEGGADGPMLPAVPEKTPLPADYLFLDHTTFLDKREGKQAKYRARTGVPLDHYNIYIIVDSYYQGALERIDYVIYFLHEAFPEPVRLRRNRGESFLLKELANGEFCATAQVFMKGEKDPIILKRYISLWESGRDWRNRFTKKADARLPESSK